MSFALNENYDKYFRPNIYINEHLEELVNHNIRYVINYLQNEFHNILYQFLYFPFEKKSYLLSPFVKLKLNNDIKEQVNDLYRIINYVSEHENIFTRTVDFYTKVDDITYNYELANLISNFYKDFHELNLEGNAKESVEACEEFIPDKISSAINNINYSKAFSYMKKFINNNLIDLLSGIYLHGSFATSDFKENWSDVDTLIVISKNTIVFPNKLLKLQKHLQKILGIFIYIDPFQNHGCFVFTEIDMKYYNQTYFPIELFKYTKSLFKKDEKKIFHIRDYDLETRQIFYSENLEYYLRKNIRRGDLEAFADQRMLLHRIYSFPLFYLQAKGIHSCKKYSFDIAKNDFSQEDWNVIETTNKVWENWERKYVFRSVLPMKAFLFKYRIWSFILKRYYSKKYNIFEKYNIDKKVMFNSMEVLTEKAWKKIIKRSD